MFRSSNVSNGETASSKAVGKWHTECQRGNFGLECILDKRDVAPEAGQPVVIGPYVIRFLDPTVRPEKAWIKGTCWLGLARHGAAQLLSPKGTIAPKKGGSVYRDLWTPQRKLCSSSFVLLDRAVLKSNERWPC